MPTLRPFRAVHYGPGAGGPGRLLAPPYDVIGEEEAVRLRRRSPYNCVRLIRPRAADREGADPYASAAATFREWLDEGVLTERGEPAAYVHAHRFRHRGEERTRLGLLAALELSPLGAGEVLPHEETHPGPKEDRLALTEATGAQLSQVFLVAPDPDGELWERLRRSDPGGGELTGHGEVELLAGETPDGQAHRVWAAPEGAGLAAAAGRQPLLLADGHHRYETALELRRRHPEVPGAGRLLACVVSEADPGLLLLPTHRALTRPPAGSGWEEFLSDAFELESQAPGEEIPGAAEGAASGAGAGGRGDASPEQGPGSALEVRIPGGGRRLRIRPREETAGEPPPLIFDRLVLRRGYGMDADAAAGEGILGYHRDPEDAVEEAGPRGAAFLLPPPDVRRVWEVAREGRRLPPKSTYFWPKLPSGLVFRRLGDSR